MEAQPRHIYRDGSYFFCPYPDFDPYCKLPNDYSWALQGAPWRRNPTTPSAVDAHVPFALTTPRPPGYAPPDVQPGPPVLVPAPGYKPPPGNAAGRPPELSMEEDRERIIQQGEQHCARFPQDTVVCHPPKPQ